MNLGSWSHSQPLLEGEDLNYIPRFLCPVILILNRKEKKLFPFSTSQYQGYYSTTICTHILQFHWNQYTYKKLVWSLSHFLTEIILHWEIPDIIWKAYLQQAAPCGWFTEDATRFLLIMWGNPEKRNLGRTKIMWLSSKKCVMISSTEPSTHYVLAVNG